MGRRGYDLGARADAMRRTREAILDAAVGLFGERWYDEVTLADVAREAGVSQQTVVNHFGGKVQLYLAGVEERIASAIASARSAAVAGDLRSIVAAVCEDYEATGDGTVRMLALALRIEELAALARDGRASHRAWVELMFTPLVARRRGAGRERVLSLLVVALDVRTWHQLRRADGLEPAQTRARMEALVWAVLDSG